MAIFMSVIEGILELFVFVDNCYKSELTSLCLCMLISTHQA